MLSPTQTQKQQRIENLLSDGLSVETIAMMTGTSVRYVNHFVKYKNQIPMKKYTVNRIVMFSEDIEVEANDENEAIHKAQEMPYQKGDLAFIDTDFYEIINPSED